MSTLPTKFLVYKTNDSNVTIDFIVDQETIWATQKSIAQLFGKDVSTISRHIKNIFDSHELKEATTIAKYATVVNRGIRGEVQEDLMRMNWGIFLCILIILLDH